MGKKSLVAALALAALLMMLTLLSACGASPRGSADMSESQGQESEIQAGQLTAGEWSDIENYAFYLSLFESGQEGASGVFSSYLSTMDLGSRNMIPVASSGIDKQTEYLFRNEALLTGGTYVFLTDDSGIGNEHLAPSIGEFMVEYLNDLLVRVINEYHTGMDIEPEPYDQGAGNGQ